MSEAALVGLLTAALAVWIALPLLRRRPLENVWEDGRRDIEEGPDKAVEEKYSIYRSILDLELDHNLGKLREDEYLRMRKESEAEALAVIAATPLESQPAEILEQEIREARERLRRRK
jgi:hypothetical protein